jgi:hypothetical protein
MRQSDENRWQGKPNRCANEAASRDQGTEGQNNPAQRGGLDGKKNPAAGKLFFLDSFYRTNQALERKFAPIAGVLRGMGTAKPHDQVIESNAWM